MNNKAQIITQVFLFILAALVFVLVLIYGYRAITSFTERSEQVAAIEFETSLKDAVKELSLDYGSVRKVALRVPSKHTELCVITSPCNLPGTNYRTSFDKNHTLVCEAFSSGTENVVLIPRGRSAIHLNNINAMEGAFCTPIIKGNVALRMKGLGNSVEIGPWQQQEQEEQ